jgi:hypothetical protein
LVPATIRWLSRWGIATAVGAILPGMYKIESLGACTLWSFSYPWRYDFRYRLGACPIPRL